MTPIYLFTDFGPGGPYVGQMRAVLAAASPGSAVIELVSDAPRHSPRAAGYLLAALAAGLDGRGVFLCVVDPGVGTERAALVLETQGRWFVAPDNGLLGVVVADAAAPRAWRIDWRPARLSATFHGRDLFAPVAAAIAADRLAVDAWASDGRLAPIRPPPAAALELAEVIYLDHFGNAMTGLRPRSVAQGATLACRGIEFRGAGTFADVEPGAHLWFENSNGLVELALNQTDLAAESGIAVGDPVAVIC